MAAELDRSGRTASWLSERTGIVLVALQSKLDARADFTVTDLADIATALGVPVASLMPSHGSGR